MKQESNNKRLKVYIPLALVILMVLAGAFYWYRDYKRFITTDDAHVDADNVSVSSKILGRLSAIFASEGDSVKQGSLLAVIDSSDLVAQKNQSVALKVQAQANLIQAEFRYASDQKSIRVNEISLERAADDLTRAKSQAEGGVITTEQFDHVKKS